MSELTTVLKELKACKEDEDRCLDYIVRYNRVEEEYIENLDNPLKKDLGPLFEEEDYGSMLDFLEGYD